MSKYTTELRFICEHFAHYDESQGYMEIDKVIEKAIPAIFNFDFPLFDPEYKNVLCTKILKHYYTREICCETYGRWKLFLESRLNEIMPYYNQLYESEKLKFNPLADTDMNTTREGQGSGTIGVTGSDSREGTRHGTENGKSKNETQSNETYNETGKDTTKETGEETSETTGNVTRNDTANTTTNGKTTSETNGTSKTTKDELNKYADTPQGAVTGLLGDKDDPNSAKYLTNARDISASENGTTTGKADGTSEGKTDYTDTVTEDSSGNGTRNSTVDTTLDKTVNGGRNGTVNESGETGREWSEDTTSTGTTKSDTVRHTTDSYVMHIAGKSGARTYSKMLMEFRDTFLNIDMQIINDLDDLFFGLW